MAQIEGQGLAAAGGAEHAVIVSLLVERDAMADVAEILTSASFTDRRYSEIFAAMEALWERRIPNDLVTVEAELQARGSMVTVLDLAHIASSAYQDIYPAHVIYYAKRVANAEQFRKVQNAYSDSLQIISQNPDLDPAEIVQAEMARVMASGQKAEGALVPTSVAIPELLRILEAERDGRNRRKVTPTGLGAIDRLMGGGVSAGELILLGARPSMGKTALALQIAMYGAGHIGPFLVFSLEMDRDALLRRALSNISYVPADRITEHRLTAEEMAKVNKAGAMLERIPLVIDDTPGITSDQIAVRVMRQLANGPIAGVMVDYLEELGDRHEMENMRLTIAARRLKKLAREADIPVILLSQVSREAEKHNPPIPQLRDLRWSGSLEAIADKIAFLYREDYYIDKGMLAAVDAEAPGSGVTQFRLDKNRNGATGIARIEFEGSTFSFRATSGPVERAAEASQVQEADAYQAIQDLGI